jgi:hypothetical protein
MAILTEQSYCRGKIVEEGGLQCQDTPNPGHGNPPHTPEETSWSMLVSLRKDIGAGSWTLDIL